MWGNKGIFAHQRVQDYLYIYVYILLKSFLKAHKSKLQTNPPAVADFLHSGLLFERAWQKEAFCSQDTGTLCSLKELHIQLWHPGDLTHFDQIKFTDIAVLIFEKNPHILVP